MQSAALRFFAIGGKLKIDVTCFTFFRALGALGQCQCQVMLWWRERMQMHHAGATQVTAAANADENALFEALSRALRSRLA